MENVKWVQANEVVAIPASNIGRPNLVDVAGFDPSKGRYERLIAHLSTGYSVATGAAMLVHLLADTVGKLVSAAGETIDTSLSEVNRLRVNTYNWLQAEHPEVAKVYWQIYCDAKGNWIPPKYLVVSGNMRNACLPFAVTDWLAANTGKTVQDYKVAIVEKAFVDSDTTAILQCRENARDDTTEYTDIGYTHLALRLLRANPEYSESDIARIVGISQRGKQQKTYAVARLVNATFGFDLVRRFAMEPSTEGKGNLKKVVYAKGGYVPLRSITWQQCNALLGVGIARGTKQGQSPAEDWVPYTPNTVQSLDVVEAYFRQLIIGKPVDDKIEIGSKGIENLAQQFSNRQEIVASVYEVLHALHISDRQWFADTLKLAPPAVAEATPAKSKSKGKAK
jgi:hypothetical protein